MRAGAAAIVALALAVAATPADAATPLEVHARRGVAGVVASGGIDVVEIDISSAADTSIEVVITVEPWSRTVVLAAHGAATVTLARRVPTGATGLPALALMVTAPDGAPITGVVPAARVLHRPVVVITDDAAALVSRVDRWRRGEALGPVVVVTPDGAPARWQSLVGVGAVVVDRPAAVFDPPVRRQLERYLAGGGQVCRLASGDGERPGCIRAAPVPVPRTRQAATIAPEVARLAAVALALAAMLALALAARSRRGRGAAAATALVVVAVVPLVRTPDDPIRTRGVRVAAHGEDWVAAEIGAIDRGRHVVLDGDLWIESSAPRSPGAIEPLDDIGLSGRIPAAGSWRVRGFVPTGAAGWTRPLVPAARPLVVPP